MAFLLCTLLSFTPHSHREMVSAIEELTFNGAAPSSVQHHGLLALGSVARQVNPSDPQLARKITQTLHAALEHLTEGEHLFSEQPYTHYSTRMSPENTHKLV